MSEGPTTLSRAHVRRQDRAVAGEGWARAMLHRAPFGTPATLRDGQPFVNRNVFVYRASSPRSSLETP